MIDSLAEIALPTPAPCNTDGLSSGGVRPSAHVSTSPVLLPELSARP